MGTKLERQTKEFARAFAQHSLFPWLCCLGSSDFSIANSSWHVGKACKKTARWVMYRHIGITNSYTLESSLFGIDGGGTFTPRRAEWLGVALGRAMISFFGIPSIVEDAKRYNALPWLSFKRFEEGLEDAMNPRPRPTLLKEKSLAAIETQLYYYSLKGPNKNTNEDQANNKRFRDGENVDFEGGSGDEGMLNLSGDDFELKKRLGRREKRQGASVPVKVSVANVNTSNRKSSGNGKDAVNTSFTGLTEKEQKRVKKKLKAKEKEREKEKKKAKG